MAPAVPRTSCLFRHILMNKQFLCKTISLCVHWLLREQKTVRAIIIFTLTLVVYDLLVFSTRESCSMSLKIVAVVVVVAAAAAVVVVIVVVVVVLLVTH